MTLYSDMIFRVLSTIDRESKMEFDDSNLQQGAKITVVGVGGGGGNAVDTMIKGQVEGVKFVVANTDVQSLRLALAKTKIQLGKELTKGLGAGADPDIGRDSALEDRHEIQEALQGADMVFITAGMGGGTGTGGASVIAQIAREMGALTVAVVTKPFHFEGKRRRRHSEIGIERLRECVDTLITIPNQRLLQIATPDLSMIDAFKMADDVLVNAVKGISDIINIPGTVNVDFADVRTVMASMGMALMGIGSARGEGRAIEAARRAICSPLLEDVDIEGATGILINITASADVSLMEVNEACSIIQEAAHEDANIIFGAVIDDTLGEDIRVTVIATGFPAEYDELAEPSLSQAKTFNRYRDSRSNYLESKNLSSPFGSRLNIPSRSIHHPPTHHKSEIEDLTHMTMAGLANNKLEKRNLEFQTTQQPSTQDNSHRLPTEQLTVTHREEMAAYPLDTLKDEALEESFQLEVEKFTIEEPIRVGAEAGSMSDENDENDFELGLKAENISVRGDDEEISDSDEPKFQEALDIIARLKGEEEIDIPSFMKPSPSDQSLD